MDFRFFLHCITVAKMDQDREDFLYTSRFDINNYLNYFNDHKSNKNVIHSADMAIVVKKNIGK